ncbi:hypothetical protein [Salmonella phage SSBI34]|nr:hypothetical protein [Salmonella phage SSBI34]
MRTVTIDFPYFNVDMAKEVIVEVEFMLHKGIKNPQSDWDSRDYLDIVSVEVFDEGDKILIDIPEQVIYSEISAQIRDAQINRAFNEETGGF